MHSEDENKKKRTIHGNSYDVTVPSQGHDSEDKQ